jgi:magnesium chelatase family protein
VSGPLLDRFDLAVEVPALDMAAVPRGPAGERSQAVRARVEQVRSIQKERFRDLDRVLTNAEMGTRELERFARPVPAAASILDRAGRSGKLSARGYCRVLRVARTLSDLEGTDRIGPDQLMEALMFRQQEELTG